MTVLTDLRDRVIALLNDRPSGLDLPDFTFTKERWTPDEELGAGEMRGAVLFHRETTQRRDMRFPLTRRTHFLAVQLVTAVNQPEDVFDALEPGRAFVVAQLGETTLDGLIHDLQEGETAWEQAKLERIHGAVTILWAASFQTHRSDLTRRS